MALEEAKIVQPVYDFFEPTEMAPLADMSHIAQAYDPTRPDQVKYRQRLPGELRRPIVVDGLDISTSFLAMRKSSSTSSPLSVQPLVKTISYFISHGHRIIVVLPNELSDPNYHSRASMMNILIKMGMVVFVSCGDEADDMNTTLNNHLVTFATVVDGCVVTSQKMAELEDHKLAQIRRRLLPPKWTKANDSNCFELFFDPDAPYGLNGADLEQTLMAMGDAKRQPSAMYQLRGCQQLRTLLALSHMELNGRFDSDFANRLYGKLNFAIPIEEKNRANRFNDYREGGSAAIIEHHKTHSLIQEKHDRLKEFDERSHKDFFEFGLSDRAFEVNHDNVEPEVTVSSKMKTTTDTLDNPTSPTAQKEGDVAKPKKDEPMPVICFRCLQLFDETPPFCLHTPLLPQIISIPPGPGGGFWQADPASIMAYEKAYAERQKLLEEAIVRKRAREDAAIIALGEDPVVLRWQREERAKTAREKAAKEREAREMAEKEKEEEAKDDDPTLFMLLVDAVGADRATRTMRLCPKLVAKSDLSTLVAKSVEFFGSSLTYSPYEPFEELCKRFGKAKATRVVQKYPNCFDTDALIELAFDMPDNPSPPPHRRSPSKDRSHGGEGSSSAYWASGSA